MIYVLITIADNSQLGIAYYDYIIKFVICIYLQISLHVETEERNR